MKNVLVFAGAGASKAVNPEAYPTTVEFFNQLPTEISSQPFFRLTHAFAQQKLGRGAVIDIEVMLWYLTDLLQLLQRTLDTRDLLGWYLEGSRLTEPIGKKSDFGNLTQTASEASPRLDTLISSINQSVYTLYQRLPDIKELENCWLPLLKGLAEAGFKVELVTTNYDLTLEAALDHLATTTSLRGDAGWRGNITRELDLSLWAGGTPFTNDFGLLTKLHGSVNWSRGGERIYVGDPEFKGSHERHAIIYPGFKGRPSVTPFDTMHGYLSQVLLASDAAIFVGFACRDEYINDLCSRYLRPTTPVVIMNPAQIASLPVPQDQVHHISKNFDTESAGEAITWLDGRRGTGKSI